MIEHGKLHPSLKRSELIWFDDAGARADNDDEHFFNHSNNNDEETPTNEPMSLIENLFSANYKSAINLGTFVFCDSAQDTWNIHLNLNWKIPKWNSIWFNFQRRRKTKTKKKEKEEAKEKLKQLWQRSV